MRDDLNIKNKVDDMTLFLKDPDTGDNWNLQEDEEEIKALAKFFNPRDHITLKTLKSYHLKKPYWFKFLK